MALALISPCSDELTSGAVTKDAKTTLQEWLQARKRPLPRYEIIGERAAHEQRFAVACEIENPPSRTIGQGTVVAWPNRPLPIAY